MALVQGWAVGGGTQLAAACDLRVCDPTSRFGVTPAKLGIVYALPCTARLVDVVGHAWACWFLLTGELVDAATALRIGLVHEVHAPTRSRPGRTRWPRRSPPGRASRRSAPSSCSAGSPRGERDEDDAVQRGLRAARCTAPEYAEGVAAFLAKRAPDFRAARG